MEKSKFHDVDFVFRSDGLGFQAKTGGQVYTAEWEDRPEDFREAANRFMVRILSHQEMFRKMAHFSVYAERAAVIQDGKDQLREVLGRTRRRGAFMGFILGAAVVLCALMIKG